MAEHALRAPPNFNVAAANLYTEWKTWINAFTFYSIATDLEEKPDPVQRATLLHCLGPQVQRIFETLPGEKGTLALAKTALENYFAPKRNVVAERYKFRLREQGHDEAIDSYATSLRELAKTCEFGELENDMIRDQIVEKCNSKRLKEKLLQQDNLNLDKTLKIARSGEFAASETQFMTSGTKENPIMVERVSTDRYMCYRCGRSDGHNASNCNAAKSRCYNCNKLGHLARVCKSSRKSDRQKKRGKPNVADKVQAVLTDQGWREETSDSDNDCEVYEPVFLINDKDNTIQVAVNGHKIKMVVDTGCKYNIISSQLYRTQFRNHELHNTQQKFIAYGQKDSLNCLGYFVTSLRAGENCVNSYIYVIEGNAESLLGRISSLDLGIIRSIKVTSSSNTFHRSGNAELDALLKEYDDIFHGLGNITEFEHKISVDPDIKPVSQRLRRIPLNQIEAVNAEIDRMLEDDVIEEITEPSPWVSNLVIVPKENGDLRVCVDLREVNKAVIRERHTLPKVEDVLNNLRGSKYFAKLDAKSVFFSDAFSRGI